jgi:sulfur-oxidizing protein SoxY
MDVERRRVLKGTGTAGMLAAALAAGILKPSELLAAWNGSAFEAKNVADALKVLGVANPVPSKDIVIEAPDFAENGASVQIEIRSNVPGTTGISLFVDKNPFAYIGTFDVSGGALPALALRVKIAESSPVRVVVAAGGKHYGAARDVKVTMGGCGDQGPAGEAMAQTTVNPMRIRARLERDIADVRVLMAHPMENGLAKDASGKPVPAHFIRTVTAQLEGKAVLQAELGPGVSRNPLLGFKVKGARAGERLTVTWEDNQGARRTDEATVSAG